MIVENHNASDRFTLNLSWDRSRDDRENSFSAGAWDFPERIGPGDLNPSTVISSHRSARCALLRATVESWIVHASKILLRRSSQLLSKCEILNSRLRGDLRPLIRESHLIWAAVWQTRTNRYLFCL